MVYRLGIHCLVGLTLSLGSVAVEPALQWAQNDTAIFLKTKFAKKWNQPATTGISDVKVEIKADAVYVSGGQYKLSVTVFDLVEPKLSDWSKGRGEVTVSLRKTWRRKWPRLYADMEKQPKTLGFYKEKEKEMQKIDQSVPIGTNSPLSCATSSKVYCIGSDNCTDSCESCPAKKTQDPSGLALCIGGPSDKVLARWYDMDPNLDAISGDITVLPAKQKFDVTRYEAWWGGDDEGEPGKPSWSKLPGFEKPIAKGKAIKNEGGAVIKLKNDTKIPDDATHILVYAINEHAEGTSPHGINIFMQPRPPIRDADPSKRPKEGPTSIEMMDEDPRPGHLKSFIMVRTPEVEKETPPQGAEGTVHKYLEAKYKQDRYTLYWGKSPTEKIPRGSFFADEWPGQGGKEGSDFVPAMLRYRLKEIRVPEGATHVIVYAKNDHGEMDEGISCPITDCKSEEECPPKHRPQPKVQTQMPDGSWVDGRVPPKGMEL